MIFMWILLALAVIGIALPWLSSRVRKPSCKTPVASDAEVMELVASVGGPEEKPPECTDVLAAFALSDTKVKYACGHEYADKFGHDFYGEKCEVLETTLARRDLCGECMLDQVRPYIIRCAACGFSIWPDEPVAVYGNNGSFKKERCTTTSGGGGVLGCMRMNCCPSGGFFAGRWNGQTLVPRFRGGGSLASQVMATGKAMVVNIDDDGSADVRTLGDGKK
jgi:hypothetical protein